MNYNLLENITAVEISTVIVDEIVEEVFIPWEVYQGIYYISRSSLEQHNIALALRSHYLQLRRQLELAYCLLVVDSHSSFYNRTLAREIKRDLPILGQLNSEWEKLPTRLLEPIPSNRNRTMSEVNRLVNDRSFINVLQQLHKKKIALDKRDRILGSAASNELTNSIYAQTSLQLDGKIENRYCEAVLNRSDRDLLIELHKQSTVAGENQWRGMIRFLFSLVK